MFKALAVVVCHLLVNSHSLNTDQLTKREDQIIKEERFLEQVYEQLGRPKLQVSNTKEVQSIRGIINSFQGKPINLKRDGEKVLVPLEEVKSLGTLENVILWIPKVWVEDHLIRIKKHFIQSSVKRGDWLGFDITRYVRNHVRRGRRTLAVFNLSSSPSRIVNAFLEVSVQEAKRQKRSAVGGSGECSSEQQSCCLSSVSVNLTTIGWDMILTPQKIEFSYCGGHCDPFRLPPGMFVSEMASLRWKIHMRGLHNLPAPCCSPANHASIEMIYITEEGLDGSVEVMRGNLENIVATSCTCG